MSFIHHLTIGYLDRRAVAERRLVARRPLGARVQAVLDARLARAADGALTIGGEPVGPSDASVVRLPWYTPRRNRSAEGLALELAALGCVVADLEHGRLVPRDELDPARASVDDLMDDIPAALRAPRRLPRAMPTFRLRETTGAVLVKLAFVGGADLKRCARSTAVVLLHEQLPRGERGDLVNFATDGDRTLHFPRAARRADRGGGGTFLLEEQHYAVCGPAYAEATERLVMKDASGFVVVPSPLERALERTVDALALLERHLREEGRDLAEVPLAFVWLQRDDELLARLASVEGAPARLVAPDAMERLFNRGGRPSFVAGPADGAGVARAAEAVSAMVLDDLARALPPPG